MSTASNVKNSQDLQAKRRFRLSIIIISSSLAILLIISGIMLYCFSDNIAPETIFTAIIGLIGTWVGTILAFYFSKDNFDAASQSTQSLVDKITGTQILQSTIAEDVMLKLSDFVPLKIENDAAEESIPLKQLLDDFFKKYNRLPVFGNDGTAKYIIHRSIIDKFISKKAIDGDDINSLSLKSITSSEYSEQIKAFAITKPTAYLASIKLLMEDKSDPEANVICSDTFITENGSKKGAVMGWITNAIINEQAQV